MRHLISAGSLGAPYLRSVIVRDAAVTTWIDDVDSPISAVSKESAPCWRPCGADGRIAAVETRGDAVHLGDGGLRRRVMQSRPSTDNRKATIGRPPPSCI